ncbi:UrcA family protein [Sandaracinobacteroides hominis]|uniref:UrcA family protein n=1 Tax=Sandaracinobacteroides hominis TaxID=2780086 RepID=UPI0018F3D7B4|nr:UrcA family protein [Sandaracinobacteroides hominis]
MTTMTNNPMFSLVLAVVASATMLSFTAVPAEAKSVKVEVSSYDLNTPAGRATVERRVHTAARSACSAGGVDFKSFTERKSYTDCVDAAVANARLQMAQFASKTQLASR